MTEAPDVARADSLLRTLSNVIGVGYGLKEVDGVLTQQPAWRVYVRVKQAAHRLRTPQHIPRTLFGVETDVLVHHRAFACSRRSDSKGVSGSLIANSKGVPGTLGCLGWRIADGEAVLLSSWHVLFGEGSDRGTSIWLVEERDGCRRFHEIGRALCGGFGTVQFDDQEFHVDCAVASLAQVSKPLRFGCAMTKLMNRKPALAHARAVLASRVTKTGSATKKTEGVIVDICYPDVAMIEGRAYPAPRQLLVQATDPSHAFSANGDSGSVILNDARKIVGLLWGTNDRGEGVACHIEPVLRTLEIRLQPFRRWFA